MTEQMDRIWAHGEYRQVKGDGKEFILAEHGHDRFTITINDDDLHIVLHLTGETLDDVLEAGCNIRKGSFYRLREDSDSEIDPNYEQAVADHAIDFSKPTREQMFASQDGETVDTYGAP